MIPWMHGCSLHVLGGKNFNFIAFRLSTSGCARQLSTSRTTLLPSSRKPVSIFLTHFSKRADVIHAFLLTRYSSERFLTCLKHYTLGLRNDQLSTVEVSGYHQEQLSFLLKAFPLSVLPL